MGFYLKPCHLNSSLKDRRMKSQQGPSNCVSWQDSHTCRHAHALTPPACLHASKSIIMLMSPQSPHVPTAYTHTQTHIFSLSSAVSLPSQLAGKITRNGQFHHHRNTLDRISVHLTVWHWKTQKEKKNGFVLADIVIPYFLWIAFLPLEKARKSQMLNKYSQEQYVAWKHVCTVCCYKYPISYYILILLHNFKRLMSTRYKEDTTV